MLSLLRTRRSGHDSFVDGVVAFTPALSLGERRYGFVRLVACGTRLSWLSDSIGLTFAPPLDFHPGDIWPLEIFQEVVSS